MRAQTLLALGLIFFGCAEDPGGLGAGLPPPADPWVRIAFVPEELSLEVGEAAVLTVEAERESGAREVIPFGAELRLGGGDRVVFISQAGELRGLAVGRAVVTATFGALSAAADVAVRPGRAELLGIDAQPETSSLGIDQQLQLRVAGNYGGGQSADLTLASTGTRYRSSDEGVAVVDGAGLIRGVALGQVQIAVENGAYADTVEITVVAPRTLDRLEVTPNPMLLRVGAIGQLQVRAFYADGTSDDVTRGVGTSYAVQPPSLAAITQTGALRALSPGAGEVRISFGGVSATIVLSVEAPTLVRLHLDVQHLLAPTRQAPYRAYAVSSDGHEVELTFDPELSMSVEDPRVVELGDGIITALQEGHSLLRASYRGLLAEEQITVAYETDRLLALMFEPPSVQVPRGGSVPIRILGRTESGNRLDLSIVTVPYAATMGNVSLTGQPGGFEVAVQGAPAPAQVTVVYDGLTAVLPVNQPPTAPIGFVLRVPRTMVVGEGGLLQVERLLSDGTSVVIDSLDPALSITTDNDNLILSPGSVLAARDGVTTISVQYQGVVVVRAFVLIEEIADPLVGLNFVPVSATMLPNEVSVVNLYGNTASGASLDLTFDPRVSYSVTGPIAYRSTLGEIAVVATGSGLANLQASHAGEVANFAVNVQPPDANLVGLVINVPPQLDLSLASVPYSVLAVWSDQRVTDVTLEPRLSLVSDAPGVLEVGTGVLLLHAVGTANLMANYQTASASLAIEVIQ